jgi:hypothetical protein
MTFLPAFFSGNWKWFSFHYPCEQTQSVYMFEYAQQLLRRRVTMAMFHRGIDRARGQSVCVVTNRDWPTPIEFANLCLPTAEELGLPSFDEMLLVFKRFSAHRRGGSGKPFVFNSDFEEHIHFKCCARYRDVKEADWLKLVRAEYDYWLEQYQMGNRPIIQKKLEVIPERVPRINRYIDKVGLPTLGNDVLSQKIRELGMSIKSKTRAA